MTAAVVDLDSDFWLAVAERCELGDVCGLLKAFASDDNPIRSEPLVDEDAVGLSKQFVGGDILA